MFNYLYLALNFSILCFIKNKIFNENKLTVTNSYVNTYSLW